MVKRLARIERKLGTRGGTDDLYLGVHKAEQILKMVAAEYDTPVADMLAHKDHVSSPMEFAALAAAIYVLRSLTAASMPRIAKIAGYEHHSSVVHALKQVERKRTRSPEYAAALQALLQCIHDKLEKETI